MDVRLADRKDLPELKSMYKKIVDNMNRNQIPIWDEIYPVNFWRILGKAVCMSRKRMVT